MPFQDTRTGGDDVADDTRGNDLLWLLHARYLQNFSAVAIDLHHHLLLTCESTSMPRFLRTMSSNNLVPDVHCTIVFVLCVQAFGAAGVGYTDDRSRYNVLWLLHACYMTTSRSQGLFVGYCAVCRTLVLLVTVWLMTHKLSLMP